MPMSQKIQWINALSVQSSLEKAVDEVVEKLQERLTGNPDLGILFISSAFASDYARLLPLLLDKFPIGYLIGCGGGGIVGMEDEEQPAEVESSPALSLTVACLPDVDLNLFHILPDDLPDSDSPPQEWWNMVGVPPEEKPNFILLSDPFSGATNELIEGLDYAYPGAIKVGGLASSSTMGVASGLFYRTPDEPEGCFATQGTIGLAMSGKIVVESIVAQGCRSIGKIYQVTKGERNIILELTDNQGNTDSPLNFLRELVNDLDTEDQELAQHSLFIGIARDEFKLELNHGDFLIRNLMGVDPKHGAIAVGDRIRAGQRIRFHLRDGNASAEDLETLLDNYCDLKDELPAVGALMFSCMGRGEGLYGEPNFDSELLLDYFVDIPVSGFFCNGEIGPVGGSTFVHGYTSVFAIFSQPE